MSGEVLEATERMPHFCGGRFCPGYRWPASNTPHPTSCALEWLNSAENLREAAESRRKWGREVSWEPSEGGERT